nr:hypothetical protein [Spirosomataceae bacterium]
RIDFIAPNLQPPDSVMYYGTSNIEFKKCKTGHRCEVIYSFDKSPIVANATYVINAENEVFFNEPCCDANLYRSLGMAFSSRYEVDFDKSSRRSFLYGLMQFPSKEGFKIPTQKVKVYLVKN